MLEAPIPRCARGRRRGQNVVTTQQLEPSLPAARNTAVRHTLGIFSHAAARYRLTLQQSIPMTEPQCGRVWQFLGTCTRSSHVGCLAVAGSWICHTVWSRSGRSSTRVMPIARTSISVSLRGSCRHGGRRRWRAPCAVIQNSLCTSWCKF